MSRKHRSVGRARRPVALAGALLVGLAPAGCVFTGDAESREEAEPEEVAESRHEATDEVAEGLAEAREGLGKALHGLVERMSGTMVGSPVPFRELYDVLPDEAGGFALSSREGSTGGALGFHASTVEAKYENAAGSEVDVTVADIGALPVIGAQTFAGWLDLSADEESDRGWRRTDEYRGYPALAEFRPRLGDVGRADFTWVVEGRFVVSMEGRNLRMEDLYELRDAIDTGALADLSDREG